MGFFDNLFKKKTVDSQVTKRGFVSTSKIQIDYNAIENLTKKYIAFDVETTGLDSKSDKIIELGAVLFENGVVTKQYSTLINIETKIPSSATAVNHITNDMLKNAPKEKEVYSNLTEFLGDALNGQTALCAHNAKFDMDFLSETLMKFGYNGTIYYVDTLSLSRNLIKGLENYKQPTVASHFGLTNKKEHRALTDAEICGQILWNLLEKKSEKQRQLQETMKKSEPNEEALEICAYIQDIIVKNGGDTEWLRFATNSSNYVTISYLYSIIKFKVTKKYKYIIVEKDAIKNLNFTCQPCTNSEGGPKLVRLYFNTPFELQPLSSYIFDLYWSHRSSARSYLSSSQKYVEENKENMAMMCSLSNEDVESLLQSARKRKEESIDTLPDIPSSTQTPQVSITRNDITINPIHNRVPLESIHNLNNWDKGYDEGHQYWEQGDRLRKDGEIETAISLFDKSRYNGYCSIALYESYAMAYRTLKDYDNEISILDEGIKRHKRYKIAVEKLKARRNKAIQLFYKQQEHQKMINEKNEAKRLKEEQSSIEIHKQPKGRPVLQLLEDMTVIKRYETIADAVRETGINSKSIRSAAKGIQKHAGGYIWKYADETDLTSIKEPQSQCANYIFTKWGKYPRPKNYVPFLKYGLPNNQN